MTNTQFYLLIMYICFTQIWRDDKVWLFGMGTLAFILSIISWFVK